MTTVNAIMERYASGRSIPRGVAKEAISELRAIPSFTEVLWTNSFCHGRYTSPSGKWTATDSTGAIEISWSVNAANGADNGYTISRNSWWISAMEASAKSAVAQEESQAGRSRTEAARERKMADTEAASATRSLLSAHRRLISAASARRAGDRADAAHWLAFAAQDRRKAARCAKHADQMWAIGQINARIVAGGAMLRDWSAPLELASLGAFPGCTRDAIRGGILDPVQTWERELIAKQPV